MECQHKNLRRVDYTTVECLEPDVRVVCSECGKYKQVAKIQAFRAHSGSDTRSSLRWEAEATLEANNPFSRMICPFDDLRSAFEWANDPSYL